MSNMAQIREKAETRNHGQDKDPSHSNYLLDQFSCIRQHQARMIHLHWYITNRSGTVPLPALIIFSGVFLVLALAFVQQAAARRLASYQLTYFHQLHFQLEQFPDPAHCPAWRGSREGREKRADWGAWLVVEGSQGANESTHSGAGQT